MHPITQGFVILAAAAVCLGALVYASDHVTCFNFLGMTKGCVTH